MPVTVVFFNFLYSRLRLWLFIPYLTCMTAWFLFYSIFYMHDFSHVLHAWLVYSFYSMFMTKKCMHFYVSPCLQCMILLHVLYTCIWLTNKFTFISLHVNKFDFYSHFHPCSTYEIDFFLFAPYFTCSFFILLHVLHIWFDYSRFTSLYVLHVWFVTPFSFYSMFYIIIWFDYSIFYFTPCF